MADQASYSGTAISDRKVQNSNVIQDPSLFSLDNIQRKITVVYYGCVKKSVETGEVGKDGKKLTKMETVKTTQEAKAEFAAKYNSPADLTKAIAEKVTKLVTFSFKNVWVDELISLNLSQTNIYKAWYNNFLVSQTPAEIEALPPRINVSVRELIDNRGVRSQSLESKSAETLAKEVAAMEAKLARFTAELASR